MKNFHLNTLDQTMLRIYVRHLHIFQFPDPQKRDEAFQTLRGSFFLTLRQLPFLAGFIQPPTEQEGRLYLKYSEEISEELTGGLFTLNIATTENDELRFDNLEAEGFPPSKLSRDAFCPKLLKNHPGLDDPFAEGLVSFKKDIAVPVLAAQANFVHGGLILSVYANHSVLDGTGVAQFYRIWSSHISSDNHLKAAGIHAEPPVPPVLGLSGVASEETQRHALDEFGKLSEPEDCPEVRYPGTASNTPKLRSTPYDLSARVFVFSSSTILKLTSELSSLTNARISSFTALLTLLWTQITLARASCLEEKNIQETKLTMAFDHRKNLKEYIDDTYLGNCATGITTSSPLAAMLSSSSKPITSDHLAPIAQCISAALSSTTLNWLKPRLSLFSRTPNPHHLSLDIDIFNGPDLFVTSWMNIGTDCVWDIPGVVGQAPKAIRKPQSKTEGNIHILPRLKMATPDAPFEVMVCLEEGEMGRLAKRLEDERWVDKIVSA
ncbi:hypothetical protein DM02DRAFT_693131 [Periconia macrospinosa]|uniref:Trichothecene 3-O-acetyltransferas-like protein n=1 Tax=Periconia macrospinosa TaxID=97972 RepID=A0A2V1D8L9_9PLEO|nr:hypothetical protein DM02DRAFT_693131 [Periconia macrospinosa]